MKKKQVVTALVEKTKVFNFGVDSLWLNFCYPALPDEEEEEVKRDEKNKQQARTEAVLAFLSVYQEQAREQDEPVATPYVFNGGNLYMYPHGGGRSSPWRYLLRSNDVEVKIGTGKKTGYVAKVRVAASYLWSWQDVEQVITDADILIAGIFDQELAAQLSEVHLCADVSYDFSKANWQDGFIRRCGFTPHFDKEMQFVESSDDGADADHLIGPDKVHMRYRPITGYSFGTHASAISAVIYNKSLYIRTKEKDSVYFHDIWKPNGWDGSSEVWRVELRLKRDFLRDVKIDGLCHGIDDPYLLPDLLEPLWLYCTIHWLRYVVPASDSNRTRWETHEAWQVVQHAYFPLVQIDLAPVVRKRRRTIHEQQLIAQIIGCAMTLHAWNKNDTPCEDEDLSLVLHRLYPAGLHYLQRSGKEFNTVVRKKQQQYSLIAA